MEAANTSRPGEAVGCFAVGETRETGKVGFVAWFYQPIKGDSQQSLRFTLFRDQSLQRCSLIYNLVSPNISGT